MGLKIDGSDLVVFRGHRESDVLVLVRPAMVWRLVITNRLVGDFSCPRALGEFMREFFAKRDYRFLVNIVEVDVCRYSAAVYFTSATTTQEVLITCSSLRDHLPLAKPDVCRVV